MGCLMTEGFRRGCLNSVGGIKRALITNQEFVSFTPDLRTDDAGLLTGIITDITMDATPYEYFYEFIPNLESSEWKETGQSNVANGSSGYETTLTLVFAKNEAKKRNQVRLMSQGRLVAIVENMDGTYWVLGEENGLYLSASSQSGKVLSDLSGWTLTFTGSAQLPTRQLLHNLGTPGIDDTEAYVDALIVP